MSTSTIRDESLLIALKGERLSDAELQAMISEADQDGNGEIDYQGGQLCLSLFG